MIYHLSHIDLDGFGCQYITKNIYEEREIHFENSNYGQEIERKLSKILKKIDLLPNEEHRIIITDLNLTNEIGEWIDAEINKRDKTNLILIDHHISGAELASKYAWYNLNEDYCATYLTYLYFKEEIPQSRKDYFKEFAEYVNVTDLWIESDKRFNRATFLSNQIFGGFRFPNIVNYLNHEYKMHIIENVFECILKDLSIRDTEKAMFRIRESFLVSHIPDSHLYDSEESLDLKYYYMIFTKIKGYNYKVYDFNGAKGKLIFDVGSGLFQYFSNFYNKEINDVDFLFHIDRRGKMSLRSRGDTESHNVSAIADKYFNGGGHFNASGGLLEKGLEHKKYSQRDVEAILEKLTNP